MAEPDEEQLDAMLRGFLGETLNPKLGAAERHFRQHLEAEKRIAWRQRSWLIGAFISGIAASVAVLWAAPVFHHDSTPPKQIAVKPSDSDPVARPVIERLVSSRTSDEGVMMLDDDTPVRVYHRQAIEQTRWFDEHEQMTAQELSPRDDVVFVKLVTY